VAYAGAIFVCVTFAALANALRIVTKSVEVAATSRQALQVMADPALDDDAKEKGLRDHAKTLGRLFVVITAGAIVAAGVPFAVVWMLDAAGVLSIDAVLDALVSWPMVAGGVIVLLAKIGYDWVWRRGIL